MPETILFLSGVLFGISASSFIFIRKIVGTLRIDTSDDLDGPHLFLELKKDVNRISKKTYAVLRVNTKSYISHK